MTTRFRITSWPGLPVAVPSVEVPRSVEITEDAGGVWLHMDPNRDTVDLPSELYLREARRVDLSDLDEVAAFVASHGCVAPVKLDSDLRPADGGFYDDHLPWRARAAGREYDRSRTGGVNGRLVAHVDEVIYRLELLRVLTDHFIRYREGDYVAPAWESAGLFRRGVRPSATDKELQATERFVEVVDAALRVFAVRVELTVEHPTLGDLGRGGQVTPTVYEAAVLQLANDLVEGDDLVLRTCPHCGTEFHRQRGRARHGQNRTRGVTYCSPECSRAASVKAYRARRRAQQNEGAT